MRFFFYGVLLPSVARWPFLRGIGPGHPATVRGRLYAMPDPAGWYPAMVPGDGMVTGMVHALGSADLAAIDAFEDYDPSDPENSLYVRRPVLATMADGTEVEAHAYGWNRSLPAGCEAIASGDFAAWLRQTGRSPFAG